MYQTGLVKAVALAVGFLSVTACSSIDVLDVTPKSGTVLVSSGDVLYTKELVEQLAARHSLEAEQVLGPNVIAAFQGREKGSFPTGIASIVLWQFEKPSRLEIYVGSPNSGGTSILSNRVFRELKANLIEHFGSGRVRDDSTIVVNPI